MLNASCILAFLSNIHLDNLNPLSANPTKLSNTLRQFAKALQLLISYLMYCNKQFLFGFRTLVHIFLLLRYVSRMD